VVVYLEGSQEGLNNYNAGGNLGNKNKRSKRDDTPPHLFFAPYRGVITLCERYVDIGCLRI
jgi:hypothetical protein